MKIRVLGDLARIIVVAGLEADHQDVLDPAVIPEVAPRGSPGQGPVLEVQNRMKTPGSLGPDLVVIQGRMTVLDLTPGRNPLSVPVLDLIPGPQQMVEKLQRKEADLEVGHLLLNNFFVYIFDNCINLRYLVF